MFGIETKQLLENTVSLSLQNKRLSEAEKAEYAKDYAGLVKHVVRRVAATLPQHVDVEDLFHEGVVGFMEALGRFDPSKGVMFKTFVSNRVRGSILDFLRRKDFASRGARQRQRELNQVEADLSQELGRYPSRKELAYRLGVKGEEVVRRRKEGAYGYVSSLNEPRLKTDERETHLDNLADACPDVADLAEKNDKIATLRHRLSELSEREQLLLNLYYFEGLNIREIAEILSVSEARISQIHRRALGRLKTAIEKPAPAARSIS